MPAASKSILLADDDVDALNFMALHLRSWKFDVHTASNKMELMENIQKHSFGLMVLDLEFGEWDGIEILAQLAQQQICIPTVFLTGCGTLEKAVQAIKLGAVDFLTKPPDLYHFRRLVDDLLSSSVSPAKQKKPVVTLDDDATDEYRIIGQSPQVAEMKQTIADVARTNAKTLILGETGTGKELVARQIHKLSPRADNAFVPVNMAALPETLTESVLFGHTKGSFTGAEIDSMGCCEAADKGTLFLDEIGEMPLVLQAKLLRFLQAGTVHRVGSVEVINTDVRVVAATNRTRSELLDEGRIREDLYYRLNVVPINVPPLRQRAGDVPILAQHFLAKQQSRVSDREFRLSDAVINLFCEYDWPGNIRQLECIIERLCVTNRSGSIEFDDLPEEILEGRSNQVHASAALNIASQDASPEPPACSLRPMDQVQKKAILEALAASGGNVVLAANHLGVGQATVYRKMKRFGIDLPSRRSRAPVPSEPTNS
tara:strand:- start:87166 stop:88623 length:1458 start_codon:yes stop_codon:yes gene_type:complete